MAATGWEHAGAYRVEVRGRLTDRFAASFDGLAIEPGSGSRAGTTVLVGPVRDQSHLMGILQTLDALGIELISVNPDQPAARAATDHVRAPGAASADPHATTGSDSGSRAPQSEPLILGAGTLSSRIPV
jgi:hypothetical protein